MTAPMWSAPKGKALSGGFSLAGWPELVRSRNFVWACVALALILRIGAAILFPVAPVSDSDWYVNRAEDIARGLGYQDMGHPTAYWPVGYPALLGLFFWIFGAHIWVAVALNLAAALGIMGAILWFGRYLTGDVLVGRVALLLYALYPAHIAYNGAAVTEPVYTAVALGAMMLLIAAMRDFRLQFPAGLAFGAATLIKAQTLLFPAGAIVGLAFLARRFAPLRMAAAFVAVYAGLACVVLPWTWRNYQVFGEFVLVSTNGGLTLLGGAMDGADGSVDWDTGTKDFDLIGVPFSERIARQVEIDRKAKAAAFKWIRENPLRYLALVPAKVALLWGKDTDAFWDFEATYKSGAAQHWIRAAQWANQAYYAGLVLLALPCFALAAYSLFRRGTQERRWLVALLMPAFVTLLCAVFTGQSRFHYPAMPFVLLAAGWSLARLGGTGTPLEFFPLAGPGPKGAGR